MLHFKRWSKLQSNWLSSRNDAPFLKSILEWLKTHPFFGFLEENAPQKQEDVFPEQKIMFSASA